MMMMAQGEALASLCATMSRASCRGAGRRGAARGFLISAYAVRGSNTEARGARRSLISAAAPPRAPSFIRPPPPPRVRHPSIARYPRTKPQPTPNTHTHTLSLSSIPSTIMATHQDWEPVVIRKKPKTGAAAKSESAINQARQAGAEVETVRKCTSRSASLCLSLARSLSLTVLLRA